MQKPYKVLPRLAAIVLSAGLSTLPALAGASDTWPERPISYVVPFTPGGVTDMVGRIYSQSIGDTLGQSIVVENRPGTGGSLGSATVARAKPDGYTLVGGTISSHSINVSIYPDIGYDPVESFAPVILTGTLPNVLVVRSDSPFNNVDDLIAAAKEKEENLSVGSSGIGSSQHLAAELFGSMVGAKLLHVPYKGSAPSLQALVSGEIDLLFDNLTSAMPLIQAGRLKPLAITSKQPDPALPEVKPLDQLGLPGYEVVSWQATFAPAGTPRPIIDKLHKAMYATLQQPEVQERLQGAGLTVSGAGPDELQAFQKAEVAKWAKVAREANIKAQ